MVKLSYWQMSIAWAVYDWKSLPRERRPRWRFTTDDFHLGEEVLAAYDISFHTVDKEIRYKVDQNQIALGLDPAGTITVATFKEKKV